jgi:DNA ligase-associated metallophosphoesterase
MLFEFLNQKLHLSPEKALYWENEKTLLVSDAHFGKAMHFRKAGIPVPLAAATANISRLTRLDGEFDVATLLILGDFFHSSFNKEWRYFADWVLKRPHLKIELIKGNHDILDPHVYEDLNITVHREVLERGPFLFSHEPLPREELSHTPRYVLSGHIHPAVRLTGFGQPNLTLPCFYFGEHQGLMPAFGEFTGTAVVRAKITDQVFVIADDEVLAV